MYFYILIYSCDKKENPAFGVNWIRLILFKPSYASCVFQRPQIKYTYYIMIQRYPQLKIVFMLLIQII